MSDQPTSAPSGKPAPNRRRSSFAELFTSRSAANTNISASPPAAAPAPSAAVPAPQQRRGTSITSLGLSGSSPTQQSPYTAFARQRRASISTSSGSGSPEFRNSFGDEPAVIEEDDSTRAANNPPPSPTFARRVSFGAQALRDVKGGGTGGPAGGRRPSSSLYTLSENTENHDPKDGASTKTATTAGEGFNWSEALRDRTKRSPSFSSSANPFASRTRALSTTTAEVEPPKEMPKPVATPTKMKKPDHLGERMLRGDFMMD